MRKFYIDSQDVMYIALTPCCLHKYKIWFHIYPSRCTHFETSKYILGSKPRVYFTYNNNY